MTIFDPARSRIIDGGGGHGGSLLRLIGLGIAAFILVILFFSAVTRVGTGHVGVLTLFGKVQTDGTLGEGIHLINPLKTNNELSIQTQTLKESASVPSSEGLMMSLDTSLPTAPRKFSRRSAPTMRTWLSSPLCARPSVKPRRLIRRTLSTPVSVRWWRSKFTIR